MGIEMENYLELEGMIIERLTDQLPSRSVRVLSEADLDGVKAGAQPVPAIHVLLYDDQPADSRQVAQKITQTWLAIVAVRNVRTTRSGQDSRLDAGELIPYVIDALRGWTPVRHRYSPLLRVKSRLKRYHSNGFIYYPLAFETTFVY